ncbi:hypothetical protein PR048_026054 [Dryococelus australis]|uniref:Uncharacterized protein n=1 Tax=Dryococelus australis TaxID=614101 RepID=A0ABQ9GK95_9NEOP|nr:hypothetical protein PR048_026054 [Dryococelus australis]
MEWTCPRSSTCNKFDSHKRLEGDGTHLLRHSILVDFMEHGGTTVKASFILGDMLFDVDNLVFLYEWSCCLAIPVCMLPVPYSPYLVLSDFRQFSKMKHLWGSSQRQQRWGEWEILEKTCRPAASSGIIPTCKNMRATSPGIEPGSAWCDASSLTTRPPPISPRGHGDWAISTLASHQGKSGSIPGRVTGFSQVGIVPDDAVGRGGGVFSGIARFPAPSFQRRSISMGWYAHDPMLVQASTSGRRYWHVVKATLTRENPDDTMQTYRTKKNVYKMPKMTPYAIDIFRDRGNS